jgi:alpha-beta hydrolase superfamily lysophospholipase
LATKLHPPEIRSATAHDGYSFAVRVWGAAPSAGSDGTQPLARVFFLHGIISHGGWYESSCGQIARAGFEVHFLDRRGAGLNAAARGDVESFRVWVRDVADYMQTVSADGSPAILAGISWGGKLALAVAQHRPDLLRGLALICPGMFSKYGAGVLQRIAIGLGSRTPASTLRVKIPLQDPRLFSDEPAWQDHILHDPLVLRRVTLRAARANLDLGRHIKHAAGSVTMPTLVMLAGRDQIIDNRRTRLFYEQIAHPTKQLVEYAEAAHTLEFGPAREASARDFADWCKLIVCDS